jgi:hypothetical protein
MPRESPLGNFGNSRSNRELDLLGIIGSLGNDVIPRSSQGHSLAVINEKMVLGQKTESYLTEAQQLFD